MMEKEQLTNAANTDPLTRLLNHSGLEQALKTYLFSAASGGTLLMIDMDYFKSVNDKLGHPAGDKVLKDTAGILESVFREGDLICRLGGDEFCVFAKHLEEESLVENRAQHLGTLGRRTYTSQAGDIRVSVSFGIGVAISHSGNNTTYGQLYERADRMLYQAKQNRRDGYVIEGY